MAQYARLMPVLRQGRPPVRGRPIGNSAAAGDGLKGFRLVGAEEFIGQIHGADREHDPKRNGQRRWNDEFQNNHIAGHRGYSL